MAKQALKTKFLSNFRIFILLVSIVHIFQNILLISVVYLVLLVMCQGGGSGVCSLAPSMERLPLQWNKKTLSHCSSGMGLTHGYCWSIVQLIYFDKRL